MFNKSIDKMVAKTSNFSTDLESLTFNSIRKVLPDKAISEACRNAGYDYRKRIITPIVTVLHMIVSAIWPDDSFIASWQLTWSAFAANTPCFAGQSPHNGSVVKARKRLPLQVWKNIVQWISQQAQDNSEAVAYWRSHRVVSVDGTCLTLADEPELRKQFGISKGNYGARKYPLAKLVCLCLTEAMTLIDYRLGGYCDDENALLAPMLKILRKGDLLVGDRHFAGANLYWHYMQNGLEYLTRAHQRLKISHLKKLCSYNTNDFIARLKTGDAYRRENPEMPKFIKARFIRVKTGSYRDRKPIWLVTSLLDVKQYPAEEIARIYLKRWRIEMVFEQLKIKGGADLLRSKSVDGIHKEVAARICAINIIRTIMLQAAAADGVDVMHISFVGAVRAIIVFAPVIAQQPVWRLPLIYQAMLKEIASHLVPERPGRLEPRKITHEARGYPKLKTTREQWRKQYAA
jgi:hypothetical protein